MGMTGQGLSGGSRQDAGRGSGHGSPAPSVGTPKDRPGLMRSLGMFVGHVARAIRTDVNAKPSNQPQPRSSRQEIRRTTTEHRVDPSDLGDHPVNDASTTPADGSQPDRSVILRRTVIDEIELREGNEPLTKNNKATEDRQR